MSTCGAHYSFVLEICIWYMVATTDTRAGAIGTDPNVIMIACHRSGKGLGIWWGSCGEGLLDGAKDLRKNNNVLGPRALAVEWITMWVTINLIGIVGNPLFHEREISTDKSLIGCEFCITSVAPVVVRTTGALTVLTWIFVESGSGCLQIVAVS